MYHDRFTDKITSKKPRKVNKKLAKKQRLNKANKQKQRIQDKKTLSHEDLVAIRTKLQNKKGRSRTRVEIALIIQSIAYNLSFHQYDLKRSLQETANL